MEEKENHIPKSTENIIRHLAKALEENVKKETADEMFEKLGYKKLNKEEVKNKFEKEYVDLLEVYYEAPMFTSVAFYKDKSFDIVSSKNMQELQAINEKVKELGWNE